MTPQRTEWRWGFIAASAIVILTVLPQILFVLDRGSNWHGANAAMHPDEVAYSDVHDVTILLRVALITRRYQFPSLSFLFK
ncbi:MAG: hypothetical protein DMF69_02005 [Acidobacteria bacterium]|nr:MAG: hypothetical protein DMF69_02005 [Acidobacteriota bacterium]